MGARGNVVNNRNGAGRWWRWFSPANLAAAAVVFCLPWIDVRCEATPRNQGFNSNTVVTQSGLQAAFGGWFTANDAIHDHAFPGTPVLRQLYTADEPKETLRRVSPAAQLAASQYGATDRKSISIEKQRGSLDQARGQASAPCWLLVMYGIAIAGGLLAGAVIRPSRARAALLIVVGGGAVAALAVQLSEGFPVQQWIAAENEALERVYDEYNRPRFEAPPRLVLKHTWCFFIAFVLPSIVLTAGLAESVVTCRFRRTAGGDVPRQEADLL
jgi:hypothetical protein